MGEKHQTLFDIANNQCSHFRCRWQVVYPAIRSPFTNQLKLYIYSWENVGRRLSGGSTIFGNRSMTETDFAKRLLLDYWWVLVHWIVLYQANRNILPYKLDSPEMWHPPIRWRPKTYSLVVSTVEVTVTLNNVLHIFSPPIDGEVVTSWTDSNQDFLVNQSRAIFGNEPVVSSSSKSYIKLAWVCHIRDIQPLDIWESIQ
ncbi:hypothetical protein Ahy_B02g058499 [Arachis hypogaea]|uniref:Aminotransferase-like plant mobile domain-containing protein n=1 Tax=Arachis hypogaea TaxID=3818 RepID=A0A445AER4_ARAHY|nr:hypothetical protein Ahy_B02g058499 [Arachis hypogaea]